MRKIHPQCVLGFLIFIVAALSEPALSAEFSQSTDPKATCSAITVSGAIEVGDYDRFALVMKETNAVAPLRRIYLNDQGGSIFTAMAIAKLIANGTPAPDAIVQAGQTCDTACLILMTGASRRYISSDAAIVIQQIENAKTGQRDSDLTAEVGKYLASNGMPPEVQQTFANLSSEAQVRIDPSNAKRFGFGGLTYYGGTNPPATPGCSWEGFLLNAN